MRSRRWVLFATCGVTATLAVSQAIAAPPAGAGKPTIDPRIEIFRAPRAVATGRKVSADAPVPVIVELATAPSDTDLAALQAAGVVVARDSRGEPIGRGTLVTGRMAPSAASRVAALGLVRAVRFDGPPVRTPRPLDLTTSLISADATWRTKSADGVPLTGAGVTICDVDNGVDVTHPLFFRADGGYFAWIDTNQSGRLEPDVDQVDLGNGPVTLRALNGIVWDRRTGDPLFGTDTPAFDPAFDYLYADENGDGRRNFGVDEGFTEASPGYGERFFVLDDVDGTGTLDPEEKLVALGTSKVKIFRYGDDIYRRGENLIEAPFEEDMLHGVGSAGVMVAGQPGFSKLVGVAPDAELIMASEREGDGQFQMTKFCEQEGARVVLHEYAPWVGFHLDGSSDLEQLIDDTNPEGMVHINPAGNLSTSKKLYKNTVLSGSTTSIPIEVPDNGASMMVFTLLWRDPSRDLSLTLTRDGGASLTLPVSQFGFQQAFDDDVDIAGYRDDSSRGTAMVMFYLYAPAGPPDFVPPGTWTLDVADPAAPGGEPLTLFGYVLDEVSGWGLGMHFPESSSEDHLIGWPGTADRGLAVAAFTGHDFNGATTGERAYYSGRGRRIDDEPLLWISAPDNPIVPGRFEDQALSYIVYGGTSGASPHVAGASALLLQADPTLTGDGVKERYRLNAVTDAFTGEVPNEDYGHGKLDVYRAIFGEAPPAGGPPVIESRDVTVASGPGEIEVVAKDPDGDVLVIEVDRDYDGAWDETLAGATLPVDFGDLGDHLVKVRATDPSGRTDQALLRVTVQPPDDEPGDDDDGEGFYPSGGACTVRGAGTPASAPSLLFAAALAALASRRSRRRI